MNTLASIFQLMVLGILVLSQLVVGDIQGVILRKTGDKVFKKEYVKNQISFFVENKGQFDAQSRFLHRSGGFNLWLAENSIWITMIEPPATKESQFADLVIDQTRQSGIVLKIDFIGANQSPRLEAFDRQDTHISYLIGADQGDWYTDLPVWRAVRYHDLYPEIDLVLEATNSFPNWYFEIHDGADLSIPRMRVQGARNVTMQENGLGIDTSLGIINLPLFTLSDQLSAVTKTDEISGMRQPDVIQTGSEIFEVISPYSQINNPPNLISGQNDLIYSTYLGGSDWDTAYGITVDLNGAAYIAGRTPSADFPTTPGAYDITASSVDVFVSKLNSQGNQLEYSTFIGGSGQDSASDIAIDNGVAFISGYTTSTDFPLNSRENSDNDAFVVSLNATGTGLLYSTLLGGTDEDYGNAIALDSGQAYLAGSSLSNDFPIEITERNGEAFVARFNSNGALNGGVTIGGREEDSAFGIDVLNGETYLTGATWSLDFPGSGFEGNGDVFVTKFNSDFVQLYSELAGGIGEDRGFDIIVSDAGVSYVTGLTKSPDFPVTSGAFNGVQDAFLAEFDLNGSRIASYYLGGSGFDEGRGIAIDGFGGVYLGGLTNSSDFPVTQDAFQASLGGSYDAFAAYLDLNEVDLLQYGTYLGGTDADRSYAVSLDDMAYIYLTGSTSSDDFPVTIGSYKDVISGTEDAFVAKIGVGPIPSVQIDKLTNGHDADQPPGPEILQGQTVTWTYVVTNTGRVSLSNISVIDDQGVTVSCPYTSLAVDEQMTCSASAIAVEGQYGNLGTVTGTADNGLGEVNDSDPSFYFGAAPAIGIDKTINGEDGSYILVGSPAKWEYQITNPGNVPLGNIVVSDSEAGITPLYQGGDTDGDGLLDLNETWVYQHTGVAVAGPHADTATVNAIYSDEFGNTVYPEASDSSSYTGAGPSIHIVKTTNGGDDTFVLIGDPINWEYIVTNTGNVTLNNINVSDSDPGVTPIYSSGDTDLDNLLDLDETWIFQASSIAIEGAYTNSGMVTGEYTDDHGDQSHVNDTDGSAYFGALTGIVVKKLINGQDISTPPGPEILVGDTITWTYQITNTGNVELNEITLSDDQLSGIGCPQPSLVIGEMMACEAQEVATRGAITNTATVTGAPPGGLPFVMAMDSSYYFGIEPGVSLYKFTNGEDVNTAPGVFVLTGDPVTWDYLITNTGNITLTQITLMDDQLGIVPCPSEVLASDASMTCTTSGIASTGQYTNTAEVSAQPLMGPQVSASDMSYYFGASPDVNFRKSTNDYDAGEPLGPTVLVGETVTWTYTITNTGNVSLLDLSVMDDAGTADIPGDDFIGCQLDELAAGESQECNFLGIAQEGPYANSATLTAHYPLTLPLEVTDISHYFGANPGIDMKKYVEGEDANEPPGPLLSIGQNLTWSYVITNTGNISLTHITVIDDNGTPDEIIDDYEVCTINNLVPGGQRTCKENGTASLGAYTNVGTARVTPPVGAPIEVSDLSHYYGYDPNQSLNLEKFTNSQDADVPPGVYILAGDTITWTYTIFNVGNVSLTGLSLSDDNGTPTDSGDDITVCEIPSLEPLNWQNCEWNGVASSGNYSNTATVSGYLDGTPTQVNASDVSHYFGVQTGMDTTSHINGIESGDTPGPIVPVGNPITITYGITNTGNITLTNITVSDDLLGPVTCQDDTLDPDEAMNCSIMGTALGDIQTHTGTVTGSLPGGLADFTTTIMAYYYGSEPAISLQKFTNGQDADESPGVYILEGDPITWSYVITNTGNITLTNIILLDDNFGQIACPVETLGMDEGMSCSKYGIAGRGPYSNTATVTATSPVEQPVSAIDSSHYFGVLPQIEIEKMVNGQKADLPPGPEIMNGDPIVWSFVITNTGNITLTNVSLADEKLGTIPCPQTTLDQLESMTCTGNSLAGIGQQVNQASVSGQAPGGLADVLAKDFGHYFGAAPEISLQKSTNGSHADTPPGPSIPIGDPVNWNYRVHNTGNVALTGILVLDNQEGVIACPKTELGAGEWMDCLIVGVAKKGQYTNLGDAVGYYLANEVSSSDASHYYGVSAWLKIFLPLLLR